MPERRWYRWRDGNLDLRVQAKTHSRQEGIGEVAGDALWVRIDAPPVEGKANTFPVGA